MVSLPPTMIHGSTLDPCDHPEPINHEDGGMIATYPPWGDTILVQGATPPVMWTLV